MPGSIIEGRIAQAFAELECFYIQALEEDLEQGRRASCSICEGRGWVGYDVPIEHPKFGQLDPCPVCQGQPADYRPPEPRLPWDDSQGDMIDFPVSAAWLTWYAYRGLTPWRPWMDKALPVEVDWEKEDAKVEAALSTLERINYAIGRKIAGPSKPKPSLKRAKPPASAVHDAHDRL